MAKRQTGKLYFAYGSNLNITQMQLRCPGAKRIAPGTLNGYSLEFRRVLTIVPGGSVQGGIWNITKRCEAALDAYEGVQAGLYRKEYVTVISDQGTEYSNVLVYIMEDGFVGPPSDFYLRTCILGLKDWNLSTYDMLAKAEQSHTVGRRDVKYVSNQS